MHSNNKIYQTHLTRHAVIYVRQSSAYQVQNNKESQQRQYALKEKAIKLGWSRENVVIIDEDLGISASNSENRLGYQKLVSLTALKKVGIIFGIEVSRLARNCLDWYELLEIASSFDTLIADEDAIFNPSDYNDRLLLGLKGTISEAELYQIKNRMHRGRLNKAHRGELKTRLPIGFEWSYKDKIVKNPDESIRSAIYNVFSLFKQIGSVRGVLLELKRRKQELPHIKLSPGLGFATVWDKPSYEAIYSVITNPTYAGSYSYGKRQKNYDPVNKKTSFKKNTINNFEVFLRDNHEGYISYKEFEKNLNTLENNQFSNIISQGAAREGKALLQGIVFCKRCGMKMRPRYTKKHPYYCCDRNHRRFGEKICGWASSHRIDSAVTHLVLEVLNEGTVDLTFQLLKRHEKEQSVIFYQWEQKIKRLSYEANLARKRYEMVDPENRLVASTLEAEWNNNLLELEKAKSHYNSLYPKGEKPSITIECAKKTLMTLKEEWNKNQISVRDKKEILRCLIDKVFVNTAGKVMRVEVVWHGDNITMLEVPKYLFSDSNIYYKIKELALSYTDSEIVEILNKSNIRTLKQKLWTTRRVMDFRLSNKISSGFTKSSELKIDQGYVSSNEASKILNVDITTIQKWYNTGIIEGKKGLEKQSKLWIYLDEGIIKSLNGTGEFDATIKTMSILKKQMKLSQVALISWIKSKKHQIVRLKRGKRYCFYVKPNNAATFDKEV